MIRRLALALALLAACGDDPGLHVAPQALRFNPAHRELALHLSHDGDEPLPLSRIRLDHREPDWSAFTIVEPVLPRQVAPHSETVLHLRVDLDHFARHDGEHGHRSGSATLTLTAGGDPRRIALHFADDTPPPAVQWVRLALLALLAAAVVALRRRISWTITLPTALALAIVPLGPGLCWDLGTILGPADLQQCADGRGGTSLQMLAHADGLGLYLAVLLFTATRAISSAVLRPRLALALALLVLAFASGNLDPQVLVAGQSGLRWGLWVQPFAAAGLTLAALAEVAAARVDPLAARFCALGLAALLTTLCLGGSDLPGLIHLPHAAGLGLGLAAWLIKVGLLAWLLLRVRLPRRAAWLVVPLLLAQLLWSLILAPTPAA